MTGFIITAGVGFVLLLVFLIFDGIFDAVHIDFTGSGVFSGASLGGFLTGLGCGGVIGSSQGWSLMASLFLGVCIGAGIAAVAVVIYRLLGKAESSPEDMSLDRLVGTAGLVTAGSTGQARGLVQVEYLGSPRTVSFSSDVPLQTGDSVIVTEVIGADVVNVIPHQPGAERTLK